MGDLVGSARYLVVRPYNCGSLAGENPGNEETLVLYDDLGAREGDLVGLVEGREATAPFLPRRVPYDCYNAAILDEVDLGP
jgi:microcompartment protein CcmK/EutM